MTKTRPISPSRDSVTLAIKPALLYRLAEEERNLAGYFVVRRNGEPVRDVETVLDWVAKACRGDVEHSLIFALIPGA